MTNMQKNILSAIALIATLGIVWYFGNQYIDTKADVYDDQNAANNNSENNSDTRQTLPGGLISFSYPEEFGLAVTKDQLLVQGYIPACDEGFEYCIYYNGGKFAGSNFDSAGVRINQRSDLASEQACLITQPAGYTNLQAKTKQGPEYKTSVFSLGNAAAGHSSSGKIYRLWHSGKCSEFETRISQSQYANYEPGSIKEFTSGDQKDMDSMLKQIIESVSIEGSQERPLVF